MKIKIKFHFKIPMTDYYIIMLNFVKSSTGDLTEYCRVLGFGN